LQQKNATATTAATTATVTVTATTAGYYSIDGEYAVVVIQYQTATTATATAHGEGTVAAIAAVATGHRCIDCHRGSRAHRDVTTSATAAATTAADNTGTAAATVATHHRQGNVSACGSAQPATATATAAGTAADTDAWTAVQPVPIDIDATACTAVWTDSRTAVLTGVTARAAIRAIADSVKAAGPAGRLLSLRQSRDRDSTDRA
jgi:hypothetical protein